MTGYRLSACRVRSGARLCQGRASLPGHGTVAEGRRPLAAFAASSIGGLFDCLIMLIIRQSFIASIRSNPRLSTSRLWRLIGEAGIADRARFQQVGRATVEVVSQQPHAQPVPNIWPAIENQPVHEVFGKRRMLDA